MKRNKLFFYSSCTPLTILLLFLLTAKGATTVAPISPLPLQKMLHQAMQGGSYVLPSATEVAQAEQLFFNLLTEKKQQKSAWEKLGWQYLPIELGNHLGTRPAIILREAAEQKKGRGFFVFLRGEPSSEQVLTQQALTVPHGFKDMLTDDIGAALFEEGHFRCAAFNTVHRWVKQDDQRIEQDLAREPSSYFTAFTRAFARSAPQGRLIQLHGFAQKKRKSAAGRRADFILSSGSRYAQQDLRLLSNCLGRALGITALTYPDQVKELGGTRNISGKILRTMHHPGFLHLEMSRPIRERLRNEAQARKKLLQCTAPRN
ncbi:MAG: hypothetical protein D3922_14340 [Candidatus Electrothrix sp. AR1]|nr:hypothetical protein [Candidatus Electrothrix sp. AR1]